VLRKLSPAGELLLVNLLCFGPFAVMSARDLMQSLATHSTTLLYDDRRLYTFVAIEVVCGTLSILLLRARGWRRSDFGLRANFPLTIAGLVLFLVANVSIAGLYLLFKTATGLDLVARMQPVTRTTWPALVLLLAIDPLYEETFEVAYNIRATEKLGPAFGITLSAAIRLICHLYQGPIAPLTILPLGLIFGFVYWKWRRVWPLAVAHGWAMYFGLHS